MQCTRCDIIRYEHGNASKTIHFTRPDFLVGRKYETVSKTRPENTHCDCVEPNVKDKAASM